MKPGDRHPAGGPGRPASSQSPSGEEEHRPFGAPSWAGGGLNRSAPDSGNADTRAPFGGSGWTGSPGLASDTPEPASPPKKKPAGRRKRASGPTHPRRTLAALGTSVDVLRDPAGVAHVYAKSERDAYAALGFCMAEDRLWQMDFVRRRATGRSAELVGAGALRRDALVRTAGIPRRAAAAASRLDGVARDVLAAFAGGVNAARARAKPPECERIGHEIEPWTIADSLAIELYLAWCVAAASWPEKLLVARALAAGGVERARIIASRPVDFGLMNDERLASWKRIDPRVIELARETEVGLPSGYAAALAGERTGGAAVLAASIELPLTEPGLLYPVCLEGPGLRSAGLAHLGMPALLAGRNDHVAWGVTAARLDDVDCVLEELDGIGGFRAESGWEKLGRRRETVRVRDGDALRLEVSETRHGPLLSHLVAQLDGPSDVDRPIPVALRWGVNSLGTALPGLLAIARAGGLDDAVEAAPLLDRSPLPMEAVIADAAGGLARVLGGARPARAALAALPVRGWVSEAKWTGLEPLSARSSVCESGFVAACGVLEDGATEYVSKVRQDRLACLLAEARNIDDLGAAAEDILDDAARAALPAVRAALDGAGFPSGSLLADWDGSADAASGGAALFYVALPHLVASLLPSSRFGPVGSSRDLALGAVARLLAGGEDRAEAIADAFRQAEQWLEQRLGPDRRTWSWGAVQTLSASHPIPDPEAPRPPAQPASGSPFTVLGTRSSGTRPSYEVEVASGGRVLSDLSTKQLRIVGRGGETVLTIGKRPTSERVELVSA